MHSSLQFLSLALVAFPGSTFAQTSPSADKEEILAFSTRMADILVQFYTTSASKNQEPGIFPLAAQTFGRTGDIWNSLLEYGHLTGDTKHNDLVVSSLIGPLDEKVAPFLPKDGDGEIANWDQSSWGLAAMTAAEIDLKMPETSSDGRKISKWIDLAQLVFDDQASRWTQICKGGLNLVMNPELPEFDVKESGGNGNFFLLSARLARFTGNKTHQDWAEKSFKWAQGTKLVDEFFRVFSEADATQECLAINKEEWINRHATYTEGAAVMYNITNKAKEWETAVAGFAKSTATFRTQQGLREAFCENDAECLSPVDDTYTYGNAMRSYGRALAAVDNAADDLSQVLRESLSTNMGPVPTNSTLPSKGTIEETFNHLTSFQSQLWSSAKPLVSSATSSETSDKKSSDGKPSNDKPSNDKPSDSNTKDSENGGEPSSGQAAAAENTSNAMSQSATSWKFMLGAVGLSLYMLHN